MINCEDDIELFLKEFELPFVKLSHNKGSRYVTATFNEQTDWWSDGETSGYPEPLYVDAFPDLPCTEESLLLKLISEITDYFLHELFEYASQGSQRYFTVHVKGNSFKDRLYQRSVVHDAVETVASTMVDDIEVLK